MVKNLVATWEDGIKLSDGRLIKMNEDYSNHFIVPQVARIEDEKIYITTVNLHLHTGYSLLDGQIKIKDLAEKLSNGNDIKVTSNDGLEIIFSEYPRTMAITDHGNMFGTYHFSNAMKENGLQPIIGCEVYIENLAGKKEGNHLVLLCKDEVGFKNLSMLVSKAEENMYKKPHVKWDDLRKHSKGLVCLSGCLKGELAQKLSLNLIDSAYETVENFIEIFKDDFYIEIQDHKMLKEKAVREKLIQIAKEFELKIVTTTDSHYLNKEYKFAHEVLLAIGTGKVMSDPNRFAFDGEGYHVFSNKEFSELFKDYPESFVSQAEIANKCQFHFKKSEIETPHFETKDNCSTKEQFENDCWKGFEERFKNEEIDLESYKERLKYEIGIIEKMNYEDYFLIVADFIDYAKKNNIAVGPGRGSAVGSMVSYCLKITDLDPIKYGLLFERFLNPDRISMPDIDIDFQDDRRHEVIEYVKDKYGDDKVSKIITFGTLAAKMAIRDVARALEIKLSLADKAAKSIPFVPGITIKKALETSPDFKKLYDTDKSIKKIIEIAMVLEGLSRHKSQHACGVVISRKPIREYVPEVLLEDKHGEVSRTAGFTMSELEDLGLLKMDFLGLRNMTIIKRATLDIGISSEDIPIEDPYIYQFLSTGNTDAIFQVESPGMKSLMKDIFYDVAFRIKDIERRYKVNSFEDSKRVKEARKELKSLGYECFERLIAAISLYRPGPMEYIPQYIEGMKNPKSIKYDCPELEEILEKTYGTIVYQEQVQQIVQKLAGYSLGRGDLIRRAMGKKKIDIMDREKEIFLYGNQKQFEEGKDSQLVPGCVNNGIPVEIANIIWDKLYEFAKYAFNKSHAAGYAVIASQTAWIRNYHKVEFWLHTLNSVSKDLKKLKKYINSCKKSNVEIFNPDINNSDTKFKKENDGIRIGLANLKNLGKESIHIIEELKNGKFESLKDLVNRTNLNSRTYKALVYSGALDMFEGTRAAKILVYEQILEIKQVRNAHNKMWFEIPELEEWFNNLFELKVPKVPEMDKMDMLEKEYEYAGLYMTEHPLDQYALITDSFPHDEIFELLETEDMDDPEDIQIMKKEEVKNVTIVGIVKNLEQIITKKGDTMYIFELEDATGSIRTTLFPKETKFYEAIVKEGALLRIDGNWENNDFGVQVILQNAIELDKINYGKINKYIVHADRYNIGEIMEIIDKNESNNKNSILVEIKYGDNYFFLNRDKSSPKRGVKINDNSKELVKIDSGLSTFAALRKITKIERE